MQSVSFCFERNQVRLEVHISKMPDHPQSGSCMETLIEKRPAHKPRLRFEDTLKKPLDKEAFNTQTEVFGLRSE